MRYAITLPLSVAHVQKYVDSLTTRDTDDDCEDIFHTAHFPFCYFEPLPDASQH